jgi:hypothetical protein
MEHFPNSLGVVEITSSMQTRSRSIGEVIGEVIAKSYVPKSSMAHTGECIEEVGGRNSCFKLLPWKRNSGQPSLSWGGG